MEFTQVQIKKSIMKKLVFIINFLCSFFFVNAQEHYIGEIKLVSFPYAPKGWALCNGQLLPINQNQALFSLLGTTYGGDGRVNFALPDLRGRSIMGASSSYPRGTKIGSSTVLLTEANLPPHVHTITGSLTLPISTGTATLTVPNGNYMAITLDKNYATASTEPSAEGCTLEHAVTLGSTGGTQAVPNMQPYVVLNYIISLTGIFPSSN